MSVHFSRFWFLASLIELLENDIRNILSLELCKRKINSLIGKKLLVSRQNHQTYRFSLIRGSCRNVRDIIIESEEKVDDIDYSVCFKRAAVFWIYISSKIGIFTFYLSDSLRIQLAQCRL